MLLSHSNTDQSYSPPHVTTSRAPSPGFSTSAPVHCGGISGRKQSSAPKSFNKLFWHQRSTEVRQSLSMKPQIAPKPTMTYSLPGFMCLPALSTTLSANTRESVINAQRIPAQETPEAPILRHSLSVESLLGLMCEKKKKFHFVRKVASSFRIKKSVEKEGSSEKLSHLPVVSSRSLPQSPQSELKSKKLFFASSEKSSVAIPWLPARSPKRIHKANAEHLQSVQGVLAQGDTLQTLSHNSDGLPLFLVRCVEYIEKEGGLETEGLYRVPGNQAQLFELEKAFRDKVLCSLLYESTCFFRRMNQDNVVKSPQGVSIYLNTRKKNCQFSTLYEIVFEGDVDIVGLDLPVHVVTTAVKNFFSCLSEPLIPSFLHNDIMNCLNESRIVERLQMVMSRLKPVNRNVLKYFTSHLYRVASSPITAMDIPNLSKVLFPTLFR
ncbi:RhoGAP domain protein [Dictyocaulus viviparus]|uniref:RhoGAP domain protein n=1 Tax=Dictyocaulus viviparus TaxID=29172 RepID=A0A0D8XCI9_DICVI|nr:RhoGAP domain protein [Dictyocaulus viviparus]